MQGPVVVGTVDQPRRLFPWSVPKPPAIITIGSVGDKVVGLLFIGERAFESIIVIRSDHHLVGNVLAPLGSEPGWKPSQESVNGSGRVISVEHVSKLGIKRPSATV